MIEILAKRNFLVEQLAFLWRIGNRRHPLGVAVRQESPASESSVTTRDRLEDPGWWPTKGDAARNQYVGSESCTPCHQAIAALQHATPMFHAAVPATQSAILISHPRIEFREGDFAYSLSRTPELVKYSASMAEDSRAANATWAMGAGEIGQTYILEKDGTYIEGRLTYYTALNALDITPGHSAQLPGGLEEALGHPLDGGTARHCFSCHTTGAVTSRVFDAAKATPGVTCEACHGPGARHVAAMKSLDYKNISATIVNPIHLAPSDSVDFCGACHRTWSDVAVEMPTYIGKMSLRFQPYRLEKSRCWKEGADARITCIGCHDPHQPLVRESTAYDAKCLACHAPKAKIPAGMPAGHVCKVASSNCVSCHMPKYEVPQAHAKFTDHDIRVVRTAGDPPP